MAASCANVIVACHCQRHPWIVWPVWWLNGSRCMNGSSFSPAFHFSWKGNSSAKCEILPISRLTAGPCSAANGNNIASSYKETRSTSLKADDHKIWVLLMLRFFGIMVPIRNTTKMNAARCESYTEVGSSLSLPSSILLVIALSVTTSDWLPCLSHASESKHLK